jgi:hypothetical protein
LLTFRLLERLFFGSNALLTIAFVEMMVKGDRGIIARKKLDKAIASPRNY